MRIFGRSKITKASEPSAGFRRTGTAQVTHAHAMVGSAVMSVASASESYCPVDLAATDEMPIVREISPSTYPSVAPPDVVESQTGAADGEDGDSDVFVCRRSSPDFGPEAAAAAAQIEASVVTLFVYGWENVEPGPLSWAFPSLRTALDAVKTMRNAIEWCIVAGHEWPSIDAARESGAVLIEQNA